MRHTWNLFAQVGSIWLAWIKSNLRRVRSFWIIKISQNYSLGWRKLLKLGELTRQFIRFVGGWKEIFSCSQIGGNLMIFFTLGMVTEQYMMLQVVFEAKVSSVLKEKTQVCKPHRSNSLVSIQSKLPLVDIGEIDRPKGAFTSDKKPGIKFN